MIYANQYSSSLGGRNIEDENGNDVSESELNEKIATLLL